MDEARVQRDPKLKSKRNIAILLLVFCGPITVPAAIVALVYNWNTKKSLESERWADAVKQNHVSAIALTIGLIGLAVQILTGSMFFDDTLFAFKMPFDNSSDYYNEITIEGVDITLPMHMDELAETEFKFTEDLDTNYVNPGEIESIGYYKDETSYITYYYKFGSLSLYNPTDEPVTFREAVVISVSLNRATDVVGTGVENPDVEWMGVNNVFKKNVRTFVRKLGRAEYSSGDLTYKDYSWYPDDNHRNSVWITTEMGKIDSIMITCRGEYDT